MKHAFTLLVADSNAFVRAFLQRELSADGYQVETAEKAREIFDHLRSGSPADLIIMDLDMPLKIGFEVLRRLYNLLPRVPVVIYTNYMEYEHHEKVQWVDAFVEKSGDPTALKAAVATVFCSYDAHCMD